MRIKYFNESKQLEKIEMNSFMIGNLLGDGCFVKKNNDGYNHNVYINFKHSFNQLDYLKWKFDIAQSFGLLTDEATVKERKLRGCYNNAQLQFGFSTKSVPALNKYKDMSIREAILELDESSFSIWMLDDGNVYNNITKISLGRFSEDEKELMSNTILNKFGIKNNIYKSKTKKCLDYIYIPASENKKIYDIVCKYIPKDLDVIKYKFSSYTDKNIVRIKYFNESKHLERFDYGCWIDVYANEDVHIDFLKLKLIKLGFALELPKGFEAHLAPRSSTFKTWGIIQANSVGVVDDTYIGDNDEWRFPAISLRQEGTDIRKGDKIGQFRVMKVQQEFNFEIVDMFGNEDRGGIGSTGCK